MKDPDDNVLDRCPLTVLATMSKSSSGRMRCEPAKPTCMIQKWHGLGITIQMPDMAQEKNMISRLDLLHDIGHQYRSSIAQDRQAIAVQEQVLQCLVRPSREMQGMGVHPL